ncbi:hypothetical protein [Klebsiella variicola]|nr:hypothetical protein [Klebsiella variicola]
MEDKAKLSGNPRKQIEGILAEGNIKFFTAEYIVIGNASNVIRKLKI